MNNKTPIIGKNLKIKESKIKNYLKIPTNPKILLKKILNKLSLKDKDAGSFDYRELLKKYGKNAVIDSRHQKKDFEYVTKKQKEILFPILNKLVKKKIHSVLDFGCGVGRFTKDLGNLFNCNVLGVDTSRDLIDLCQIDEKVKFLCVDKNCSQVEDKFDLVFIAQVINGISDNEVIELSKILTEKINDGGFLFLIETTSKKNIEAKWRARTKEKIISFFPKIKLKYVSQYIDIDREVSIFFGHKIN